MLNAVMTTEKCPCCDGKGTIEAAPPCRLTLTQRKIYDAVRSSSRGVSISKLANEVYGDRIDGGPVRSLDCIRAHVYHMNKRLAAVGEIVRTDVGAGYMLFRRKP